MLGHHYKFHVINQCGQTLDFSTNGANESCTAKVRRWKYDTDGSLIYEASEGAVLTAASDLADGSSEEGSDQDNTTNLYLGLEGVFTVKTDNASAAGDVTLAYEESTDGGTTYPSDAADFDPTVHLRPLAIVTLGGAETQAVNFWVD